jgi:capsular polysaccharide biosynthesis protein
MDLKEYIVIFKNNSKTFVITVFVFLLAGILFQLFRPLSYKSSLTLNITRSGAQETADYKYDDFYRLQADEKFGDTVVRWLGSARIVTDVLNDSKITTSGVSIWRLSRFFKTQRLSSQLVQVTYFTGDAATAQNISKSILKIIASQTEELNQLQKEENWFKVLGDEPVVKENKFSWILALVASLALGIFFGIWAVFIRHYIE